MRRNFFELLVVALVFGFLGLLVNNIAIGNKVGELEKRCDYLALRPIQSAPLPSVQGYSRMSPVERTGTEIEILKNRMEEFERKRMMSQSFQDFLEGRIREMEHMQRSKE